jgi:hypothetical protein
MVLFKGQPGPRSLPDLNRQSLDPPELGRVVRDQGELALQGLSGDQGVVGPDRSTIQRERRAELADPQTRYIAIVGAIFRELRNVASQEGGQ